MLALEIDVCADCSREPDIIQRTRPGNIGYCKRHALAHRYLMRTRGPIRDDQRAERIRQLGRALAHSVAHPDEDWLDVPGRDLSHVPLVQEFLQKLESDRVYEPGEDFDGKTQGTLTDIDQKGENQ